ncbi:MAG: serine/threonine-protein phosphatase [Geminicoccaceae bacterium]|nr:serine/threonine-protein phosphatase [Geminicoccaceae bacterium]
MSGAGQRRWRSAARTHVGLVRRHNEDCFVERAEDGLFAVADGMGGLSRGDRASGLVRERLELVGLPPDLEGSVDRIEETIADVNARLLAERAGGRIMGSTVVAIVLRGERFACIWAGDSRLYRSGDGGFDQLTRDHSVVAELVAAGSISEEAARHHPLSNRITRAVGVERRVELETFEGVLRRGDRLLLCSDGLSGFVDSAGMARLVRDGTLDEAADNLVQAALDGGGRDNITVLLVEIPE